METLFKNRNEAAFQLASLLIEYRNKNVHILAIPRGGIPIGNIFSKKLDKPMDIALSKKIGHPFQKEFAIGAVNLNEVIIDTSIDVPMEYIEMEIERIRKELKETYKLFRGNAEPFEIKDKIIIVTDDGVATGKTMLSTVRMIQKQEPAEIIVAVPVIAPSAVEILNDEIDKLVTLAKPPNFRGVGQFYEDFSQVSDEEIIMLLKQLQNNI